MKIRLRYKVLGGCGNHINKDQKKKRLKKPRLIVVVLSWMIVIAISAVNIIQSTTVIVVDNPNTDYTLSSININTLPTTSTSSNNVMVLNPPRKTVHDEVILLNTSSSSSSTTIIDIVTSSSSLTTSSQHTTTKRSLSSFPKVFGIGFKKTGTSTLEKMFREISSIIVNLVLDNKPIYPLVAVPYGLRRRNNYRNDTKSWIINEYSDKHYYFQDNPWFISHVYKHVAQRHPTSKFILTTRNPNKWYDSVYRWVYCPSFKKSSRFFGLSKLEWYRELFNAKSTSKVDMIDSLRRHQNEVRQYFAMNNQSYRLLEIDLTDPAKALNGKGWYAICDFLELPLDRCPTSKEIPHTNALPKRCHNVTIPYNNE